MTKPTIFFSHSSKDKAALARLKEQFSAKSGGTIDVFLSSDGQSIPLGRNWVHRVESALDTTPLMIVFITPNSVTSSWIYFEAGYAYSKGVRVVPVGLLGIDLSNIPPPLSLLQGFNIRSCDGLDNLIALANSTFSFSLTTKFSREEYDEIVALADNVFEGDQSSFAMLNEFYVRISKPNDEGDISSKTIAAISRLLESHHIQHARSKDGLFFHGVAISIDDSHNLLRLYFHIDPFLIDRNAPLLNEIAMSITDTGFSNSDVTAISTDGIYSIYKIHSVSARIYGSGITILSEHKYQYKTLHFSIRSGSPSSVPRAFIDIFPQEKVLPVSDIRELINILTARNVFYRDDNFALS